MSSIVRIGSFRGQMIAAIGVSHTLGKAGHALGLLFGEKGRLALTISIFFLSAPVIGVEANSDVPIVPIDTRVVHLRALSLEPIVHSEWQETNDEVKSRAINLLKRKYTIKKPITQMRHKVIPFFSNQEHKGYLIEAQDEAKLGAYYLMSVWIEDGYIGLPLTDWGSIAYYSRASKLKLDTDEEVLSYLEFVFSVTEFKGGNGYLMLPGSSVLDEASSILIEPRQPEIEKNEQGQISVVADFIIGHNLYVGEIRFNSDWGWDIFDMYPLTGVSFPEVPVVEDGFRHMVPGN